MDFTITIPESEYVFGFVMGLITMGIAALVTRYVARRLKDGK